MLRQTAQKAELFARVLRNILLGLFVLFALTSLLDLMAANKASAAVSSTINFQARLENSSGAIAPDGDYNVEFKIYDASSSSGSSQGSCTGDAHCLWTETRISTDKVHVANGYLTVNLGSVTTFASTINWNQELWLTMNIGGTGSPGWDGEMSPRLKLTAVPYALQSGALGNGTNSAILDSSANLQFNQASTIRELSAGSGTQLTIQGGAATSGTNVGGNLLLQGGAGASTGASGSVIVKSNTNNSATAFVVQNASTAPVLTVDTSNGKVILGQTGGSGINGQLVFNSATASNYTTTLIASSSQTATYSLTLPTSGPSTSQCIKTDATTASQLTFASCGGGGGGVTLQGSTPGTPDTGNFNVSGTGIAGILQAGSGTAVTTFNVFSSDTTLGGAIIQNTDTSTHGASFAPLILQHDSNTNGDSTGIRFRLKNSSGSATTYGMITSVIQSNTAGSEIGQLLFQVNNTGAMQSIMTINGAGVGIEQNATFTPQYPLHVIGDTSGTAVGPVVIQTTTSGSSIGTALTLDATPTTGGHKWSFLSTGPSAAQGAGSFAIFDGTANQYRAVIDTSGNFTLNSSSSNVVATFNGTELVKPTSGNDSTSTFQVQNAAGWSLVNVDTTSSNLVANPSFEINTTGWVAHASSGSPARDTTEKYIGSASGKTAATSTNHGLEYTVSLTNGSSYALSAWVKFSATADNGIAMGWINSGSDQTCTLNGGATPTISTSGWTYLYCTFTAGASSTAIYIKQTNTVTRTIFIDGVQLLQQSTVTPYRVGTMSINPIIISPTVFQNQSNSTTAFLIQNAAGTQIVGVDTLNSQVLYGAAGSLGGKLTFYSGTASNNNTVSLTVGNTSSSYTLTLPTGVGTTGQCLKASDNSGTLTFGACVPSTTTITFVPEYVGATFSQYDAAGTSSGTNVGFMQSDHVAGLSSGQGYKHNYYQWSTDQSSAQDYHIILEYQLPTTFASFVASSFKIWTYIDSSTSTDLKYTMYDVDGTACYSGLQSIKPGSTATWTQTTLSDPGNGCSFASNDVVTIDIKMVAIQPSTNFVKVGELQFGYN